MFFNYILKIKSLIFLCFVIFIYTFIKENNHLISRIIILESLILITILYLFLSIRLITEKSILLLNLRFAAAEAAIGLSLLIRLLRLFGNDKTSNINF